MRAKHNRLHKNVMFIMLFFLSCWYSSRCCRHGEIKFTYYCRAIMGAVPLGIQFQCEIRYIVRSYSPNQFLGIVRWRSTFLKESNLK